MEHWRYEPRGVSLREIVYHAACTAWNSAVRRLHADCTQTARKQAARFISQAKRIYRWCTEGENQSPPSLAADVVQPLSSRTRRRCVRECRGEVPSKGLRRRVRSGRTGNRGLHAIPSTLRHTSILWGFPRRQPTPRNFVDRIQQVIHRRFALITVIRDISQPVQLRTLSFS